LPNWWEAIRGLNPNSPPGDFSDSNADRVGDEFTELERYLNWSAAPHGDCAFGTSLEVDLTRFARGFTNTSPVFNVFVGTNGNVTLLGGKTARFTSTVGSNALGSFTFTVTDSQGGSLTNAFGIHILALATAPPMLGIRNQSGALFIEITGESGRSLTVQSKTNLSGAWLDWTNVTASGTMQLLPLSAVSNQSARFFRAFEQ
jgi:hypothetical protein